jgi:hypothetical protein
MKVDIRTLIAEVLDEGLDDWIILGHVINRAAKISGLNIIDSRPIAMEAVRTLIVNELAIPGGIGDSGFEAWGLDPLKAFRKLQAECERLNWELGLTDVWLATTPMGDQLAGQVRSEGDGVLDYLLE